MREHVEEPRYVTTDDDTVYSLLSKRAARTPDDIIAEWQDDNTHQWRSATATEMLSRVREVAKGLLGLGVKAGTMVLIYSPTCYEWGVADFACAAIGAVVVPVYETDSARQTAGIVEEVDPAIAFAGDFQRAQTLEQIRVNHPGMKYVFNFKADGLDAVVDFGHGVSDETLDAAIARIKADDLLTVVYPKYMTCDYIVQYVRALQNEAGNNIKTLYRILDDRVEALEFTVHEESAATGVPLSQLHLKKNLLLCCITRGSKILIPRGGDQIQVGDNVIVVTLEHGLHDLRDIVEH